MTDPSGTSPLKHCASCGAPFSCGMDDPRGCWCASLPPLPAGVLVAGSGCLCETCLRALVAQETAAAEQPASR